MKSDINAAKSYDGITDYDISTLIENIQRIMKERNMIYYRDKIGKIIISMFLKL